MKNEFYQISRVFLRKIKSIDFSNIKAVKSLEQEEYKLSRAFMNQFNANMKQKETIFNFVVNEDDKLNEKLDKFSTKKRDKILQQLEERREKKLKRRKRKNKAQESLKNEYIDIVLNCLLSKIYIDSEEYVLSGPWFGEKNREYVFFNEYNQLPEHKKRNLRETIGVS